MAYLTLVVNPSDDVAAKRVINVPRRGIGKSTVERVEQSARDGGLTFMQAAELAIVDTELRPAARKALGGFVELVKEAASYGGDLRRVVEAIIDKSGLVAALQQENTDEARGRIENIKEFLGVVDEYTTTHDVQDAEYAAPTGADAYDAPVGDGAEAVGEAPARVLSADSLADFIEWVTLRTDLDTADEGGAAVTLMTVHASKGLEFDYVFVAGMEESIFPHMNTMMDPAGVEEERRLAYVAITRARKHLCLTRASTRQLYGQSNANPPSRFLAEIPAELTRDHRRGQRGLRGHRLGEARQPSRHFRLGRRGRRWPRVRPLERFGLGPQPRERDSALATARRGQEGGRRCHVRGGRRGRPQDLRTRQGGEGGRRHAAHPLRQDRRDQEAAEGLRAHRQGGVGRLGRAKLRVRRRMLARRRRTREHYFLLEPFT